MAVPVNGCPYVFSVISERVEELQGLESEERVMYNQLRREIQQLESGLLDHQLDAFWEQLVKYVLE